MSEFKIIPNNTVTIHDGADSLYHIIPSGFENKYIVVDGGPHFNGETEILTKEEIFSRYKLNIENYQS